MHPAPSGPNKPLTIKKVIIIITTFHRFSFNLLYIKLSDQVLPGNSAAAHSHCTQVVALRQNIVSLSVQGIVVLFDIVVSIDGGCTSNM